MIARVWRGEAEHDNADAYYRHVTTNVFPALERIDGHLGAYVLRRDAGTRVEFLVVTLWGSLDAIKKFAGPNPEVAVVEPEAKAVLAEFDGFVRHYELAHAPHCGPAGGRSRSNERKR